MASDSKPQNTSLRISQGAGSNQERALRSDRQSSNLPTRPSTSASFSTESSVSHNTSNMQPRKGPNLHSLSPESQRAHGEPHIGKRGCSSSQLLHQESIMQPLFGIDRSKKATLLERVVSRIKSSIR